MSLEETELIASAEAALHQAEDSEQIEEIEEETECSSGTHLEVTSTVTAQMSQTSSTTVPAPASATPTLQKIAPKPAIVKQAAVAAGSKIVYLKSPNGTPQPIRIGGQLLGQNATAAAANSTNAPGSATSPAIQFIKTLDGNFLQIKNKNVVSVQKTIAPTPTTPVVAGNSTASSANNTRFVVKSGNGSRLILATPPTAIASKSTTNATAGAATTTSGGNTRTLTVSQAQQVGLISSAKLKELVAAATAKMTGSATANKPAAIAPATVAGTAAIASVNAAKGPPTILNKGVKSWQSQKILLQSKSGTSNNTTATTSSTTTTAAAATTLSAPTEVKMAKPIGQNVVKISQTSHLRAVNVAGKGLQYVRVLNSSGSGSSPAIASSSTTVVRQSVTNGRQQPVFVQRKILPNTQASTSGESSVTPKPQFITKKLEVTPVASTTAPVANRIAIARSKPNPPTLSKSTAILLNNTQKPVVNTPIDIKPASGHSQSFEITTVPKNEPLSPSQKTASIRTIRDKRSSTPDPLSSTLYYSTLKLPSPEPAEANRSRKHCNCTKSQCLKLYCDCFASGEFCQNCNCKECFNTLEKEDERQKAIKICLERNPHAFKPKIGKARDQSDTLRRHTKGCNCKRSGCLKNYCECYEAKIVCSGNCKCIGCRNVDDTFDHNNDRDTSQYDGHPLAKRTNDQRNDDSIKSEHAVPAKKPCNFITPDVIEATIQCVIAQADDCQKNNYDAKTSERKILEEFGRCLVEIIDFSKKNNDNVDE